MKKVSILILLLLVLGCRVYAQDPHIVDEADLLTSDEEAFLEKEADRIAREYEIDIVILTVDSLGSKDPETYADDYYDSHDYGYGSSNSGVLFMLSMEYRDWAISTTGDGIYALTDYGIQEIFSSVAADLSQDEYYSAFGTYLGQLEGYFEAFVHGAPADGPSYPYEGPGTYEPGSGDETVYYEEDLSWKDVSSMALLSLGIGAVIGGVAVLVMRSGMNTAKSQTGANAYVSTGLQLSLHRDMFLYSNTRRVRRDTDSGGSSRSHSGGGSRVHRSSSGRSHGGGHGKF